ncbi:MAG: hypothetical protein DRI57_09490 [Deltaproteobacteria bacterium]|nr:MAG: hypothetical protein DRI57_09490 [Deltaproteobacteria bacterium]
MPVNATISIVAANKKKISVWLIVWLTVNLFSCMVFYFVTKQLEHNFYRRGVSAVRELIDKNFFPLVDMITIGSSDEPLNVATDKFGENLEFAAILDRSGTGKILAHTDSRLTNQPFVPKIRKPERIDTMPVKTEKAGSAKVVIEKESQLIRFSSHIIADDSEIGWVCLTVSAFHFHTSLSNCKILLFAISGLATLILLILLFMNRTPPKWPPKRIGLYELKHMIEKGGMAVLYYAVGKRGKRGQVTLKVAVKIVLPNLVADHSSFLKMFENEAELAASLEHPNIVRIIDFHKEHNAIVMEYIRGRDMAKIISKMEKGLSCRQSIFIALNICMGLKHAHSKKNDDGRPLNIVHRDIKPSNILISFEGEVKIVDFGIAKAKSDPGAAKTMTGDIKGTLSYMSPEQASGKAGDIDHRSDIFSFGLVFYEMLSGKKLYAFGTDVSIVQAVEIITNDNIAPLTELKPEISPSLNSIVMKCLKKERESRYQNTEDIYNDLRRVREELNMPYETSDLSGFMQKNFGKRRGNGKHS